MKRNLTIPKALVVIINQIKNEVPRTTHEAEFYLSERELKQIKATVSLQLLVYHSIKLRNPIRLEYLYTHLTLDDQINL